MTRYDFTPLYRNSIGFDRMARLMDAALRFEDVQATYPPYNIEKTGEDAYRITLATAGFHEDELNIEVKESTMTVTGRKADKEGDVTYLHRGIAARDFVRRFELADHVKVTGANLSDGLLTVDLVREVPEEMRPRRIEIKPEAPKSLIGKAKKLIEPSSDKKAA